jgi:hypothetical protein
LQSKETYAGRTLLVVATDHGRHLDDVSAGFLDHGHGWLPGQTGCAPNCAGCRDIWAIFAGPGITRGLTSDNVYQIEDIAPTVRHLMGFENPYERGTPIEEIIDENTSFSQPPIRLGESLCVNSCRPNPFQSYTTIRYLALSSFSLEIQIFDVNGRKIWAGKPQPCSQGWHSFTWNGEDEFQRSVPPGVYYLRLKSGSQLQVRKLTRLR